MTPADIESMARAYESDARGYTRCALRGLDEVERLKRLAEDRARDVAKEMGLAAGLFFRAAELRYDARGGMTAELDRRRFEPGARWALDGVEYVLEQADDSGHEPRIRSSEDSCGHWERTIEMTRANGWLFLGLSDPGGYR